MDPANPGPGQYGGYQPPPPPPGGGGDQAARAKVAGPAIGLIIVAAIGICFQILGILWKLFMGAMAMSQMENDMPLAGMRTFFMGPVGIALGVFGIVIGVLILIGAVKMKNLQSYGLAMAVTILAMIPCISPCCILGIPIGIWALIVLLDPNVKAAFRS